MFVNYERIYKNLVKKGLERKEKLEHKEVHHIIPRCLSGENIKSNLVSLTPREHFIAHLLLYKIYKNKVGLINDELAKLSCAIVYMANTRENKLKQNNSRLYEKAKIISKQYIGKVTSNSQLGENNSNFGNIWITNKETFESKLIHKNENIPDGWIKGRKIVKETAAERRHNYFKNKRKIRYEKYIKLLEIRKYQKEFSWEAACEKFNYTSSVQNFSQTMARFRKRFDEIFPYCEGYTKEEVLELIKPVQGYRNDLKQKLI